MKVVSTELSRSSGPHCVTAFLKRGPDLVLKTEDSTSRVLHIFNSYLFIREFVSEKLPR